MKSLRPNEYTDMYRKQILLSHNYRQKGQIDFRNGRNGTDKFRRNFIIRHLQRCTTQPKFFHDQQKQVHCLLALSIPIRFPIIREFININKYLFVVGIVFQVYYHDDNN